MTKMRFSPLHDVRGAFKNQASEITKVKGETSGQAGLKGEAGG